MKVCVKKEMVELIFLATVCNCDEHQQLARHRTKTVCLRGSGDEVQTDGTNTDVREGSCRFGTVLVVVALQTGSWI